MYVYLCSQFGKRDTELHLHFRVNVHFARMDLAKGDKKQLKKSAVYSNWKHIVNARRFQTSPRLFFSWQRRAILLTVKNRKLTVESQRECGQLRKRSVK